MFTCYGFAFYNIFVICVSLFTNVVHMCFTLQVIDILYILLKFWLINHLGFGMMKII